MSDDVPISIGAALNWYAQRPLVKLNQLIEIPALDLDVEATGGPYVAVTYSIPITYAFTVRQKPRFAGSGFMPCIRYVADGVTYRWRLTGKDGIFPPYVSALIQPTRAALEFWADGTSISLSIPLQYMPIGIVDTATEPYSLWGTIITAVPCTAAVTTDPDFAAYMTSCSTL